MSDHPSSLMSGVALPKIRTSTRDQVRWGCSALNRRLIRSRWCRSWSRFNFSRKFFSTRSTVCSQRVPFLVLESFVTCRSAACWFTATSLISSSSATAGFDRDQLRASNRSLVKKHLRLARAALFVSLSFDPPWPGMEICFTGTISLSMLIR